MATQQLLQINGEQDFGAVLKERLPTIVDFYADWCGPCRAVGPVIESLSREYEGRARFVKVNVDANEGLASRYNVESIPTVIVFNGGQAVDRVIGVASPQVYRAKINAVTGGSA
jgi:thioredoxin